MLKPEQNQALMEVGPSTLMGDLLRRYWTPFAAAAEMDKQPTKAVRLMGEDRMVSIPIGLLLYVALIWYLLACAHIWRAALDSGLLLGGLISVGYLVLSIALEQQMLPPT